MQISPNSSEKREKKSHAKKSIVQGFIKQGRKVDMGRKKSKLWREHKPLPGDSQATL